MFLKSLSMKGFKSFADPTVLEFEPGITVVVGPNGSGKSNVVDAVTWVLGAQGPRALRSQKMEDVIFAGTTSRPALGRAEVSLTIDNSSGSLPVDMAEVTITRTLFRTGDSEYAINGTPCRLLDIQELLSDSGVGRSQHMIVGQGQLDTVLNARPEERRAVIEEAAGVLKHRRRRERAERRLTATAENLERLGDLVRELRRQIRPLERQAQAARSHAELAAQLRAVRIHLAGTELNELDARQAAAAEGLASAGAEEERLAAALDSLDTQAAATAAALSSRRDEDLASALGRVEGLVERARGTANVLRERSRALTAALDAAADVDVVSALETDAARVVAELAQTGSDAVALEPESGELEALEAQLHDDLEGHRAVWARVAGPEAAEAALAEATRRHELQRRTVEQEARALDQAEERVAALVTSVARLDASTAELVARREAAEAEAARLAHDSAGAEEALAGARRAAEAAEAAARAAEQERHRNAARAEALARALRDLEGAGGREALAGVDGVVGTLVDLVEIDPGWEPAFEAAAGASVAAVVVSGRDAARAALSRLHQRGATGALLAARAVVSAAHGGADGTGGTGLAGGAATGPVPVGAERVRPHVRLRRAGARDLETVLDALVGRAVRVQGWEEALELALDRPDLVVVTSHGDRFARSGWRVRSAKGVVTAAAVEEAEERAATAAEVADRASAALIEARRALDEAAAAAQGATRARDRHEAARAAVAAEARRVADERGRLLAEATDARRVRAQAEGAAEEGRQALAAVEASLAPTETAAAEAREQARRRAAERAALEGRAADLAARRHAFEVKVAALSERRRLLEARQVEVERRLSGHAAEREAAAARRLRLEADGVAVARLDAVVDGERQRLDAALGLLRSDYRDQVARVRAGAARMEVIRQERSELERRVGDVRERVRRFDREVAESRVRTEALVATVEEELGVPAAEARQVPQPDLPDGVGATAHAADLSARLAALGPVNPLALDELSVLDERHRELDAQMEDVRAARRQLLEVVRTLDREISETFAAAAADVNEHFSALVGLLFPGGTGRLSLTEPEDLLNTGVEIEVRPAGRNVRRVSLLSGGERSMAALAFLFAVFRSRPSPFYLLDEVEAALDDVNLHRFLGLVHDFRDEAQLIVVSHQKRTMEAADALYGVTMAPGGSSQVVSQKAREGQRVG